MDNDSRIEALEATGIANKSSFAASLIGQYHQKGRLTDNQWEWVDKLTKQHGGSPIVQQSDDIKEVFNGEQIRTLLQVASEKLLHPKLRYPTDKCGKIIFSYVADVLSKWNKCIFISNDGRENKKRYGFIGSNGQGSIRRESPPEVKAAILAIAKNPTEVAKLTGQKYSFCCFCGLGLINKSSIHHGYGPICASNYGLPWGDTGDEADEEAAAQEEMKHIQLTDL